MQLVSRLIRLRLDGGPNYHVCAEELSELLGWSLFDARVWLAYCYGDSFSINISDLLSRAMWVPFESAAIGLSRSSFLWLRRRIRRFEGAVDDPARVVHFLDAISARILDGDTTDDISGGIKRGLVREE